MLSSPSLPPCVGTKTLLTTLLTRASERKTRRRTCASLLFYTPSFHIPLPSTLYPLPSTFYLLPLHPSTSLPLFLFSSLSPLLLLLSHKLSASPLTLKKIPTSSLTITYVD